MAKDDKKKQAMSLLFGDVPEKPREAAPRAPTPRSTPSRPAAESVKSASTEARAEKADAAAATRPAGAETARSSGPERASRGPEGEGGPGNDAAGESEHRDPYYEGQGRYRRKDGVRVKKSVYLDPDVWRAVSVAAAVGDDPRGSNASEIINTLLREAGYEG